jgi:hypothetical protein
MGEQKTRDFFRMGTIALDLTHVQPLDACDNAIIQLVLGEAAGNDDHKLD